MCHQNASQQGPRITTREPHVNPFPPEESFNRVTFLERWHKMERNFQIKFKKSNGNLHLHPAGDLDGSSASVLVQFLHEKYEGKGRVFIETDAIQNLHPFGCHTFQRRLNRKKLPADRIYFKGEKGFKLAPSGSRVLISKGQRTCRCQGRCENCKCGNKHHHDHEKTDCSLPGDCGRFSLVTEDPPVRVARRPDGESGGIP